MQKLVVVVALCLLAGAFAAPRMFSEEQYGYLFKTWVQQFGKGYAPEAVEHRMSVFKENLDFIARWNEEGHSATLAMNEFGDLTWDEFKATHLSLKPVDHPFGRSLAEVTLPAAPLPESVDWVKAGAVTPVKNQQQCGSCWAFSATGAMEGACFIKGGVQNSLSEQELVDCSRAQGNEGCNGGWMDNAFEYAIVTKGLCNETSYPYTARDGTCKSSQCKQHFCAVSKFVDVPKNDELQLKAAVAQQPIAVAIEADQPAFQFYKKGVFTAACGTNLDHGVLLAGYGKEDGKMFWLVKNSWGAGWGDQGYIKLVRADSTGKEGQCGIAMAASYPVMA